VISAWKLRQSLDGTSAGGEWYCESNSRDPNPFYKCEIADLEIYCASGEIEYEK